ncbi:MAG: hypothetical protein ACRD2O_14685 [Terriglobia bacterium]
MQRSLALPFLFIVWFVIFIPVRARSAAALTDQETKSVSEILRASVQNFDNHGEPLVPTLLQIAKKFRLPLGIEKVNPPALHKPLVIYLADGTVSDALNLCVHKLPGYRWTVLEGAVLVYGPEERNQPSNLFDVQISSLTLKDATVNEANDRLSSIVFEIANSKLPAQPALPPGANVGYGGDSPGVTSFEKYRLNLDMKNTTVRAVLNRLVAISCSLGQPIAWMARIPPSKLSEFPEGGLWQIVPLFVPQSDDTKNP